MFFDSHAHLNFKPFQKDYHGVIERCFKNNVWLINVGSKYDTSEKAISIAENYQKGVWAAIGLHPTHVGDEIFVYQKYLALARSSDKVVAIGETGLDYAVFVRKRSERLQKRASAAAESEGGLHQEIKIIKEKQKEVFLKHIELAQELNKPLIIHCRLAHEDLIEILFTKVSRRPSYNFSNGENLFRGVIHCFTGNQEQAEKYLEMGFYLGFTGIITYSSEYDKLIKDLPLEKILIETDCPYLTPVPYRGQRNEPLYVKYVAQKIADIHGLPLEKVAEQTVTNALNLFQILL